MSLTPADVEIPPAFSARLKARNPVLAAADSDGHLFRIFYERRRRLGKVRLFAEAYSGVFLMILFYMVVPNLAASFAQYFVKPMVYLFLIVAAALILRGVILSSGPIPKLPLSLSKVYAATLWNLAVAQDIYMCGVPPRQIAEALYAEEVLTTKLQSSFWLLVIPIAFGLIVWRLSSSYPEAALALMALMLVASLEYWLARNLIFSRHGRSNLKLTTDRWVGGQLPAIMLIQMVAVLLAIIVLLVVILSIANAFAIHLDSGNGSTRTVILGLAAVVIVVVALLMDRLRRHLELKEPELVEAQLELTAAAYEKRLAKELFPE